MVRGVAAHVLAVFDEDPLPIGLRYCMNSAKFTRP
jgi:peptide methionine sulfoxide reductase MsrB